jgi:hypothetical protein
MAKVLYDFDGQKENELSIKVGQLIEIVQKEDNGKRSLSRVSPWPNLLTRPTKPSRLVAGQERKRPGMGAGGLCRGAGASSCRRAKTAASSAGGG